MLYTLMHRDIPVMDLELDEYGKHNLPCKPTALQRIAKEHKELLGYGCGVIML